MNEPKNTPEAANSEAPLSLARLTAAFAKMLRPNSARDQKEDEASDPLIDKDQGVTVRGVVEAMLFVGEADNAPIDAEQIAEAIRDVGCEEVDTAVEQLNAIYERDDAPYRIVSRPGGYRYALQGDMERLRERMQGRIRSARLSTQALETLAVIAYRQPIDAEEIETLRGAGSKAALAQLRRRGLVSRNDPADNGSSGPQYLTTDRFLRVFGLSDPNQLPRVAELDD